MPTLFAVLSWLFILAGLVLAYWLFLRPILARWSVLAPKIAKLDAAEAGFFAKLNLAIGGLKTKLSAWLVMFAGAALSAHDFILPIASGVDVTPISQSLPSWSWPVILIAVGAAFRFLRKITSGPEAPQ